MKRDALVVGINQYPFLKDTPISKAKHLTTPATDAEALAQLLEAHGDFNVKRLPVSNIDGKLQVDPNKIVNIKELEDAIVNLFSPDSDNAPETALLFFAGHGLRKPLGKLKQGFLAASNAIPSKDQWGFSLRDLWDILQESQAQQQIIWLDCCFSGELLNFKKTEIGQQSSGCDRFLIAASRDYEVAYEQLDGKHGVLTGALLEGLNPYEVPESDWVTNRTLAVSVEQKLQAYCNLVKIPQFPLISNHGEVIKLIQGRDKANLKLQDERNTKNKVLNWKPYLESISSTYAHWWEIFTLTDIMSKKHNTQVKKSVLMDLKVSTVELEKKKSEEDRETKEILDVLSALRKYAAEHLLLIGRPGSGKSTVLARLLLEIAANPPLKSGNLVQIPVLIELRYYQTSVIDLIKNFLHCHDSSLPIDSETLKTLLRQRQFFLLLDGVNELPSSEARRDLQKFRQDFQKTTPMIFTTRDLGMGGDLEISKKLEMQPLTETQMRDFVFRYLSDMGELMLQQLGSRLREFGQTPMLLWMLCSVFDKAQNKIPANLGLIFRLFTEQYVFVGQDDKKIQNFKGDVPNPYESREFWQDLLQELAFVMTTGNELTGQQVTIAKLKAEEILRKFLHKDFDNPGERSRLWLNDLLKHHLIIIKTGDLIEFSHQLIQEYYTAEKLLQQIENLSDEELQWRYLNYLKWTEPVALMMELINDEELALRVVKLALQVDWQFGARLAGTVKSHWQEKAVMLLTELELPRFLEIWLLGITKSDAAIPALIQAIEDEKYEEEYDISSYAQDSLATIGSVQARNSLIEYRQESDDDVIDTDTSANAIFEEITTLNNEYLSEDSLIENSLLFKEKKHDSIVIITLNLTIKLYQSCFFEFLFYNEEHLNYDLLISQVIQSIKSDDNESRNLAFNFLRNINFKGAINPLINILHNENDNLVRHLVMSALKNIVSDTEIPILIKLLQDKDFLVRLNAVCALGKIGSDAAIQGLIIALQDKSEDVSSEAAFALGDLGSTIAIPALIQVIQVGYNFRCVGFEDNNVFMCAVNALGKIASDNAIYPLIQALKTEENFAPYCRDNFFALINTIKIIQEKHQYYKPSLREHK